MLILQSNIVHIRGNAQLNKEDIDIIQILLQLNNCSRNKDVYDLKKGAMYFFREFWWHCKLTLKNNSLLDAIKNISSCLLKQNLLSRISFET